MKNNKSVLGSQNGWVLTNYIALMNGAVITTK